MKVVDELDAGIQRDELAERLDRIEASLSRLVTVLDRFLPLLESYEAAKKANGFLAARRALKGQ